MFFNCNFITFISRYEQVSSNIYVDYMEFFKQLEYFFYNKFVRATQKATSVVLLFETYA